MIAMAALLLLATSPAWAGGETVVVRARANLRAGPSTRAARVGRVAKGASLAVLDHQGEWYAVERPGGGKAWISQRLVRSRPAAAGLAAGSQVQPKERYATLRAGPSRRARALGRLEQGASLAALARDGDWFEVQRPDGSRAWVAAAVVRLVVPQAGGVADSAGALLAKLQADYPGVVRWAAVNDVVLDHYHEAELDMVVESSWHFLPEGQRLALLRQAARAFAELLRTQAAYRQRYTNRPLVVVRDASNTVVGSATPQETRLF
ncbi:MAG: hypothetical protein COW73_09145 [Nitrospirae bacterium CG18_big_fil_WC_8_21_14_2_50_70_55]|nr:MAG: hypothetical protein AUK30_10385 [Nitrospirae bacterium CG2_30_70_394]PIQ04259.1 MAG: hypothetical protein COW73_09145 [Nitrospirae bacterium CG18_big_fil_WC_8_21_14_2_50_70_55]PIU78793.1 MAG: hypothetical protein COS73_06075 [Nitrospirae bacterium CG06_land_8_20_14_3_00_70_43]PIW81825.1 MAG: hypothetical protein COZ96_12055 [Nitrospirae bacterium CG_4_8_14_3_um_filter_70_85]PIX83111.1 MAG: hypothetical protein COZ33_07185 [Nitrospirae bacterium CG_4_10_14_3_um_filter_70_108]PJB95165.1